VQGREVEMVAESLRPRWAALEALVEEGLVREIGVSNFEPEELEELLSFCKIRPVLNECEAHPYLPNCALVDYCRQARIQFLAYSPQGSLSCRPSIFGGPREDMNLFKEGVLLEIAASHCKSVSQVLLGWALQRGTTPITKSLSPDHLEENLLSNFQLTELEMQQIGGLARTDGRIFTYLPFKMYQAKPSNAS